MDEIPRERDLGMPILISGFFCTSNCYQLSRLHLSKSHKEVNRKYRKSGNLCNANSVKIF